MPQTLDMLSPGTSAVVVQVTGEPETAERLMEMGLIEGTRFSVVRLAPMGDPIEIEMRGYHLTLRKNEASGVVVETEG